VISSSPTSLQPVLDTIARNAALVCGATDGVVHLVEGGELPIVAHYGLVGGIEAESSGFGKTALPVLICKPA
jgi:hypothetical protein